jgi:hypothetical protein
MYLQRWRCVYDRTTQVRSLLVSTQYQLADMLTKDLEDKVKFKYLSRLVIDLQIISEFL